MCLSCRGLCVHCSSFMFSFSFRDDFSFLPKSAYKITRAYLEIWRKASRPPLFMFHRSRDFRGSGVLAAGALAVPAAGSVAAPGPVVERSAAAAESARRAARRLAGARWRLAFPSAGGACCVHPSSPNAEPLVRHIYDTNHTHKRMLTPSDTLYIVLARFHNTKQSTTQKQTGHTHRKIQHRASLHYTNKWLG